SAAGRSRHRKCARRDLEASAASRVGARPAERAEGSTMNSEETLDWLRARRSVRSFTPEPVGRSLLERLFEAAVCAPSSTNRQPWRFACVTGAARRARIVDAVRKSVGEMKAIIRRGHHADDFGSYGDFFWEPLASAAAIVVPQYRAYPDLIANL